MINPNDKIDWSDFNETEQQAIAIHSYNVDNGTNNPTFPYSAVVFEELAENLASIALIKPNSALQMVKELQAINKVLLNLMQTGEDIKQHLLNLVTTHYLVNQFSNITNQILFTLEAEAAATGGDNGTKH